ncbi:MAG: hypothetical protein IPM04_04005 [Saprospiraceae bacterium]|nr:hypothetical protein [Candidatus Brachybacter algidus]MBK8747037.1 hypothetical protein [Candidatus Brachybacter algidus]
MTAPVAFSPLVLDGNILKPFMSASLNKMFNCEDVNDRVLVVVQMKGGNDGLNCVVPTNQYDMYKNFRPTIGTDLNKLLTLDSSLSNQDQVSLHPNLASFKALYEKTPSQWFRQLVMLIQINRTSKEQTYGCQAEIVHRKTTI